MFDAVTLLSVPSVYFGQAKRFAHTPPERERTATALPGTVLFREGPDQWSATTVQ